MRVKPIFLLTLLIVLSVSQPVTAELGTAGVSDFLAGTWKSYSGEMTYLLLHNPTGTTRLAVILYYREQQKFNGCHVLRLTPHDFEKASLKLPPPNESSPELVIQGQGVVEIRSAPVTPEDPNHPGGITGYIQVVDGESIYEFDAAAKPPDYRATQRTLGIAPLFPVDPKLFSPITPDIRDQYGKIRDCVCEQLEILRAPDILKQIFCIRIE